MKDGPLQASSFPHQLHTPHKQGQGQSLQLLAVLELHDAKSQTRGSLSLDPRIALDQETRQRRVWHMCCVWASIAFDPLTSGLELQDPLGGASASEIFMIFTEDLPMFKTNLHEGAERPPILMGLLVGSKAIHRWKKLVCHRY